MEGLLEGAAEKCARIYGYSEESAGEAEHVYFERERKKGPLQDVLLVRSVSIMNRVCYLALIYLFGHGKLHPV